MLCCALAPAPAGAHLRVPALLHSRCSANAACMGALRFAGGCAQPRQPRRSAGAVRRPHPHLTCGPWVCDVGSGHASVTEKPECLPLQNSAMLKEWCIPLRHAFRVLGFREEGRIPLRQQPGARPRPHHGTLNPSGRLSAPCMVTQHVGSYAHQAQQGHAACSTARFQAMEWRST